MANSSIIPIPLTNIASSAMTSSYQAINTTGLPGACFTLNIINNSDESITISYDGVNDHDFLLTDTSRNVFSQTNAQPSGNVALFSKGTKVYVKGTAGTGNVYLSGFYQIRS